MDLNFADSVGSTTGGVHQTVVKTKSRIPPQPKRNAVPNCPNKALKLKAAHITLSFLLTMERRRRVLQRVEMFHVAGYPVGRVEVSWMGHRHRGKRRLSSRLGGTATATATIGSGQSRAGSSCRRRSSSASPAAATAPLLCRRR